MPRQRKKKTERGSKDLLLYEQAYEEILNGRKIRAAASMFGLCHMSLIRYKKKKEKNPDRQVTMGYNPATRVLTDVQEQKISTYLIQSADIYFGLPPKEVRRLAYELAVKYNLKRPESWDKNKTAGVDWFSSFMKRNPNLAVRCAEATSLSRATSFNRTNVMEKVMDRHNFESKDICNMDETGVTTVQKPDRIVARKGTRQVGALTSGERGTLVTAAMAVNALGHALPPLFIFPRQRYQDHFVRDGPPGCVGVGYASGWMEATQFLKFLEHFRHYTKPSVENKVLLLLDNHPSHVTIEALDFCKENGIVMLSFPPHCSHKLQPLDVSVHGPLKKAVNSACDAWMRSNPGQTMTIYNIPSIVAEAFLQVFTPRNIQAGFRKASIYPYNREAFDDTDFAPSYVTDRPLEPTTQQSSDNRRISAANMNIIEEPEANIDPLSIEQPPESHTSSYAKSGTLTPLPSTSTQVVFCPELVRPLPKAPPRKNTNRGRKKRKSAIYTDTPEKNVIQKEAEETGKRKKRKIGKMMALDRPEKYKGKVKNSIKYIPKAKKSQMHIEDDNDDEEDECFCLICTEAFSASRSSEIWIQCSVCQMWAHEECTAQDPVFICQNCESD